MSNITPYRLVAKNVLCTEKHVSEEEAQQLVEKLSYNELERLTDNVGGRLEYAVTRLARGMNLQESEQSALVDAMLKGGYNMTADAESIVQRVMGTLAGFDNKEKMIVTLLSAMHDGWVKDNASRFNIRELEGEKYKHLPAEMIGWQDLSVDIGFLQPLLDVLNVSFDGKKMEDEYCIRVYDFFVKHELMNEATGEKDYARIITLMTSENAYKPRTRENTAKSDQEGIRIYMEQVTPRIQEVLERGKILRAMQGIKDTDKEM